MTGTPASELRDEAEFSERCDRHRRELQLHCYRMLGSYEEAEDTVQETFLRAWRARVSFGADGRSDFRAWLYRIATNACLDALRKRPRRVVPHELGPPADPAADIPPPTELPWLQPYPDRLLEGISSGEAGPDESLVAKETVELTFIAAIQHLPPRQRAVLILRDVLGWSAKEAASQLDVSVASVNSALQRARETLREQLGDRSGWARRSPSSRDQRELLDRYLRAHEEADVEGFAAMLHEEARLTMPPHPVWFDGRDAVVTASAKGFDPDFGQLRGVPIGFNLQPAMAWYLLPPGAAEYTALAFDVLRVEDGLIVEIYSFVHPELFSAAGLPEALPAD
jgi:RNA polymerase sigma-70 factor, ECF subfamily